MNPQAMAIPQQQAPPPPQPQQQSPFAPQGMVNPGPSQQYHQPLPTAQPPVAQLPTTGRPTGPPYPINSMVQPVAAQYQSGVPFQHPVGGKGGPSTSVMDTYDRYRGRPIVQQQQQQSILEDIPTIEYRGRNASHPPSVVPASEAPPAMNRFDQRKAGGKGGKGQKKKGKSNANQTPLGPRKIPEAVSVGEAKPQQRQETEKSPTGRKPLGEFRVPAVTQATSPLKKKESETPQLDRAAMADMYKQAIARSDVPQWKLAIASPQREGEDGKQQGDVVDLTGDAAKQAKTGITGGGKGSVGQRKMAPKYPRRPQQQKQSLPPPPPPPPPPVGGEDASNWTDTGQWRGSTTVATTNIEYSEEMKEILP
ncbi:hypothetical protein FOZ62_006529, partial [Perkinsus olseni]